MSLCHHFPDSYKYFFSYVENGKLLRDHRDERGTVIPAEISVGTSTCAHSLHVGFAL